MTASERAAQIWSALALAATNRMVLNYEILEGLTGVPRFGLGNLLEPIQSYCLDKKLPPLTILVVQKDSGVPSTGFVAADDIPKTQMQVFEFDWLAHRCPSPDDFAQAVARRPSNGIPAAARS